MTVLIGSDHCDSIIVLDPAKEYPGVHQRIADELEAFLVEVQQNSEIPMKNTFVHFSEGDHSSTRQTRSCPNTLRSAIRSIVTNYYYGADSESLLGLLAEVHRVAEIPTKNTFVHFPETEHFPERQTQSCPTSPRPRLGDAGPASEGLPAPRAEGENVFEEEPLPKVKEGAASEQREPKWIFEDGFSKDDGRNRDEEGTSESSSTTGRKFLNLFDEPGMPSAGSADHAKGTCRPCAFFHTSPRGCVNGRDCIFCHMCPPGAMKKWKKERQQWKRMVDNQKNSQRLVSQSSVIEWSQARDGPCLRKNLAPTVPAFSTAKGREVLPLAA